MNALNLKPHPAAELFPMMSEGELNDLAKDIKDNQQKRPIVLFEGKILDGRNRYEACKRAGIAPTVEQWNAIDPRTGAPRS
ncbi:MAG TPA: ParB N-terminal domain-containing protein, partial [Archangium sp.]